MAEAWKEWEKRVAALFGARRAVLSGGSGRDDRSRSDSTHDRLFIEVKMRAKTAVRGLFDATKALAKKEGKVPVLGIADKGRPGVLLVVHSDDLDRLVAERLRAVVASRKPSPRSAEALSFTVGYLEEMIADENK